MNFCQVCLSCIDEKEARKIAGVLLQKRLVSCVKQYPITSAFHWKGKIEHSDESSLVMDSREDLFDEIEAEVTKLHSYDTFVLQAMPITKLSKKAKTWLDKELRS